MRIQIRIQSFHMAMATLRQASPKDKFKLQAALRRLGMSQAELCRRIGRHPSYLARVLSGKATSATVWRQAWAAVRAAQECLNGDVRMAMSMDKSIGHAAPRVSVEPIETADL